VTREEIERAEKWLKDREEFITNFDIVDCATCQRRTMPDDQYPKGICMAYNQAPGFVYEKCLKNGCYKPKTVQG
jgi:hypothetical protein